MMGTSADPEEMWKGFGGAFEPDQLEALEDSQVHETLYRVFAASVQQKTAVREAAAPSAPRRPTNPHATNNRPHVSNVSPLPKRWKDLKDHEHGREFEKAAQEEIANLERKQTWKRISREHTRTKPLPLKWVFNYKFDQEGFVIKHKARICVRGDLQDTSTLQGTYAATLAARTFRTLMALAAQFDLEVKQFDVAQAFLNVKRSGEPVVCELPEGFKELGLCVQLEKALYGLQDSPLLWYREFSAALKQLGMEPAVEEPCLFLDRHKRVIAAFYVDDILVLYHHHHQQLAERVMQGIRARYEVHEQGDVAWFLGIRVIRERRQRKLWLVHDQYIEKIAKKYRLDDNAVLVTAPLRVIELTKFSGQATKAQIKEFQELVGSILYCAVMIRLEIAFACAKLSRFLTNPGPEHREAAQHVIRYLFQTRFLCIMYGGADGAQVLSIAADSSFADDPETRRSSQGFVVSLFGGPICWQASRQDTVTTSSTEAELLALTKVARETLALQRLFRDLAFETEQPWVIHCDNQQTIRLVVGEHARINTRLRHVDIQNLWARQEHSKGRFEVVYLPTSLMPADGLTKALPRQSFEQFRALLNLQSAAHLVEKHRNPGASSKRELEGAEPQGTTAPNAAPA
jgi:hypothetical protein